MKRVDLIEAISVVICLSFAIMISLYHISYDGYMGLTERAWGAVWAVAENGFAMFVCFIVSIYSWGIMQKIFRYVMIPYFVLKLIYHFSCYSGIYLLSAKKWEYLWSYLAVALLIITIGYCFYLIKKKDVA